MNLETRDNYTAQKMKFSIKDFFSKCGLHLLKKSLIETSFFVQC